MSIPKELQIKPAYPHLVKYDEPGDPPLTPDDLRNPDDIADDLPRVDTPTRDVLSEEFRKENEAWARLLAEVARVAYRAHL